VINELETIRKAAVMACFKVAFDHLPGATKENHENPSWHCRSAGRISTRDSPNLKQRLLPAHTRAANGWSSRSAGGKTANCIIWMIFITLADGRKGVWKHYTRILKKHITGGRADFRTPCGHVLSHFWRYSYSTYFAWR